MTVQYIDVTIAIWGKDIFALKLKTVRKKKTPVTEDLIQAPNELIKLHRYIVVTEYIFFVKKIPLFLILSRNNALPWYIILQTGKFIQSTLTSMKCASTIESGYLLL